MPLKLFNLYDVCLFQRPCEESLETLLWKSFVHSDFFTISLKRNSFTDVFRKEFLLISCILIDKT